MISAFEVYLIMQLDTIRSGMAWVLSSSIIAILGTLFVSTISLIDAPRNGESELAVNQIIKVRSTTVKYFWAWLCVYAIYSAAPNTKTVAAMVVVPILTSENVVKPMAIEVKRLYEIGVSAIEEMVNDAVEEHKKQKTVTTSEKDLNKTEK